MKATTMSYAQELDSLFAVLGKEYADAQYDEFEEHDYLALLDVCRGMIVLACKEQATGQHRNYSGRIKELLQYMHKIGPELGSNVEQFYLRDVNSDDFTGWEHQSRYVASVLKNMRESPAVRSMVEKDLEEIIIEFKNTRDLGRAVQIVEGWTATLECR